MEVARNTMRIQKSAKQYFKKLWNHWSKSSAIPDLINHYNHVLKEVAVFLFWDHTSFIQHKTKDLVLWMKHIISQLFSLGQHVLIFFCLF